MYKKGILILLIAILFLWLLKDKEEFPKDGALARRVLITGASSGIGEQLAYQYAKHGASIFITARREDRLKRVIAKCKELAAGYETSKFGYLVADMANYKIQSKKFVEAGAKHLGGIDTIVLNHVLIDQNVLYWLGMEEDLQVFEKHTDINYKSYVYLFSYALPFLKKAETGRVGIVGSLSGKLPTPQAAMYSGVKFALDGFFSSLRAELAEAKTNISITYGVIGGTDTELLAKSMDNIKSLDNDYMNNMIDSFKDYLQTPEYVAHEIMVSTENGDAELYCPSVIAPVMPIPFKWLVLLKTFVPQFSLFSIPDDVFKTYEKMALEKRKKEKLDTSH